MKTGTPSVASLDRLMGHDGRREPERLRGAADARVVLVGVVPAVHAGPSPSGLAGRVSDIYDRLCLAVTFLLWVVLPVLGIIGLILPS